MKQPSLNDIELIISNRSQVRRVDPGLQCFVIELVMSRRLLFLINDEVVALVRLRGRYLTVRTLPPK